MSGEYGPSPEDLGLTAKEKEKFEPKYTTPEEVRFKAEKNMRLLYSEINVEGKDRLTEFVRQHPNDPYEIAFTHFTGADIQAPLSGEKGLGNLFDIQITMESVLQERRDIRWMVNQIGPDRFTALDYKESDDGKTKSGVFNPMNFDALEKVMGQGRTPLIAAHAFTQSKGMTKGKIGPVYLAQKTKAWIVPTALTVEGGAMTMETSGDKIATMWDRLRGKTKARYHIGEPIKFPPIDGFEIIEQVLKKRGFGEKPTTDELKKFHQVHQELKRQADGLARAIADLIPEKYRGVYKNKEQKIESEIKNIVDLSDPLNVQAELAEGKHIPVKVLRTSGAIDNEGWELDAVYGDPAMAVVIKPSQVKGGHRLVKNIPLTKLAEWQK